MFQEAKEEDIMENTYGLHLDLQLGSYFLRPSMSWMRRNFHERDSRLQKGPGGNKGLGSSINYQQTVTAEHRR